MSYMRGRKQDDRVVSEETGEEINHPEEEQQETNLC